MLRKLLSLSVNLVVIAMLVGLVYLAVGAISVAGQEGQGEVRAASKKLSLMAALDSVPPAAAPALALPPSIPAN